MDHALQERRLGLRPKVGSHGKYPVRSTGRQAERPQAVLRRVRAGQKKLLTSRQVFHPACYWREKRTSAHLARDGEHHCVGLVSVRTVAHEGPAFASIQRGAIVNRAARPGKAAESNARSSSLPAL